MMEHKSLTKLKGVHPDLINVITDASILLSSGTAGFDFVVTEGVRTVETQRKYVAEGRSKTMRSRHIPETNKCGLSCAVDLAVTVNGKITWDYAMYEKLSEIVKNSAKKLGIDVEWGGDWKTFKDGPHFQISAKQEPYA